MFRRILLFVLITLTTAVPTGPGLGIFSSVTELNSQLSWLARTVGLVIPNLPLSDYNTTTNTTGAVYQLTEIYLSSLSLSNVQLSTDNTTDIHVDITGFGTNLLTHVSGGPNNVSVDATIKLSNIDISFVLDTKFVDGKNVLYIKSLKLVSIATSVSKDQTLPRLDQDLLQAMQDGSLANNLALSLSLGIQNMAKNLSSVTVYGDIAIDMTLFSKPAIVDNELRVFFRGTPSVPPPFECTFVYEPLTSRDVKNDTIGIVVSETIVNCLLEAAAMKNVNFPFDNITGMINTLSVNPAKLSEVRMHFEKIEAKFNLLDNVRPSTQTETLLSLTADVPASIALVFGGDLITNISVSVEVESYDLAVNVTQYNGPESFKSQIFSSNFTRLSEQLLGFVKSKIPGDLSYAQDFNFVSDETVKDKIDSFVKRGFTGAVEGSFVTGISFVEPT